MAGQCKGEQPLRKDEEGSLGSCSKGQFPRVSTQRAIHPRPHAPCHLPLVCRSNAGGEERPVRSGANRPSCQPAPSHDRVSRSQIDAPLRAPKPGLV